MKRGLFIHYAISRKGNAKIITISPVRQTKFVMLLLIPSFIFHPEECKKDRRWQKKFFRHTCCYYWITDAQNYSIFLRNYDYCRYRAGLLRCKAINLNCLTRQSVNKLEINAVIKVTTNRCLWQWERLGGLKELCIPAFLCKFHEISVRDETTSSFFQKAPLEY